MKNAEVVAGSCLIQCYDDILIFVVLFVLIVDCALTVMLPRVKNTKIVVLILRTNTYDKTIDMCRGVCLFVMDS